MCVSVWVYTVCVCVTVCISIYVCIMCGLCVTLRRVGVGVGAKLALFTLVWAVRSYSALIQRLSLEGVPGGVCERSLQLVVCVEIFLFVGAFTCVSVVVGGISSSSVLGVSHSCSAWVAFVLVPGRHWMPRLWYPWRYPFQGREQRWRSSGRGEPPYSVVPLDHELSREPGESQRWELNLHKSPLSRGYSWAWRSLGEYSSFRQCSGTPNILL